MTLTETNHQGNHRLLLFINAAVESEKKPIIITAVVQPASIIRHIRTVMGILGGKLPIKISELDSRFQYGYNKSSIAEALEEYALSSAEVAYEDIGKHAPMGFISSGGEFHEAENDSHWLDHKHPSFTIPNYSENTK